MLLHCVGHPPCAAQVSLTGSEGRSMGSRRSRAVQNGVCPCDMWVDGRRVDPVDSIVSLCLDHRGSWSWSWELHFRNWPQTYSFLCSLFSKPLDCHGSEDVQLQPGHSLLQGHWIMEGAVLGRSGSESCLWRLLACNIRPVTWDSVSSPVTSQDFWKVDLR